MDWLKSNKKVLVYFSLASLGGLLAKTLWEDGFHLATLVKVGVAALGYALFIGGMFGVIGGGFVIRDARRDPTATTTDWRFRQWSQGLGLISAGGLSLAALALLFLWLGGR